MKYTDKVLADLRTRHSHQPEFLQAVEEVLNTLQPLMDKEPKYEKYKILERIVEPERIYQFRV